MKRSVSLASVKRRLSQTTLTFKKQNDSSPSPTAAKPKEVTPAPIKPKTPPKEVTPTPIKPKTPPKEVTSTSNKEDPPPLPNNPKKATYGISGPKKKKDRIQKTITPPTFAPDDFENIKKYLDEEGYVVLRDIITEQEHEEGMNLFWESMKQLNPKIDPNDTFTWQNSFWPGRFSDGISTEHGIPHSKFMWYNRTRPAMIKIFSYLLNSPELVVSFDGMITFRPGIPTSSGFWPHVDQNIGLIGSEDYNIQGAINYEAIGKDMGGFCCVPGSHKGWSSYLQDIYKGKTPKTHGHMIDYKDPRLVNLVKLVIPARSATIWLGKTIHCSTSSKPDIPMKVVDGKPRLDRLVALVSYAEADKADLESVKRKYLDCLPNNKGTTHWARLCVIQPPNRWGRPKNSLPLNNLPVHQITKQELDLVIPNRFKKHFKLPTT